jgi:hypothetical protein
MQSPHDLVGLFGLIGTLTDLQPQQDLGPDRPGWAGAAIDGPRSRRHEHARL